MRLPAFTPLRLFAAVSLVLIVATAATTATVQSAFFREAVIQREGVIVRDMVTAIAEHEIRAHDLDRYAEADARIKHQRAFGPLLSLSGVARVKVYNADQVVVWSDNEALIGRRLPPDESLRAAIRGGVAAEFDPGRRRSHAEDPLPDMTLVEFYVPFSVARPGTTGERAAGAVAVYRSAEELSATLAQGMRLLWLVSGVGGVVLFGALYSLFRSVYRRQRRAESQFAKLSTDHERIVQMEKLSAMGRLVAEIAHQFNNPLMGVINLAQLAEREAEKPERVRSLLADIRLAGEHCRDFIGRMLRFAQAARSELQPLDLSALVRDTAELFRQSVPGHPEPVLALPAQAVPLQGDPVLLRHALFNLLDNAARAAPGAAIEVTLAAEAQGGCWRLTVADRGPGLPAGVLEKLFTPFFTTREGGTGLGLSIAQHIAVQHGGRLWAENRQGGGACFHLCLPDNSAEDDHENENSAG